MSQIATPATGVEKSRKALNRAVIRFAGDSGDGMQLTGEQFTTESAWAGNDLATLPNFPAEIRAPAGTLFGVSSFQLQFGSQRVYTPGDRLDCLVAMNPAALKVHLRDLKPGGLLIVNTAAFEKRNLDKAGYAQNPLDDPALAERYRLHKVDMTGLTHKAIADLKLDTKEKDRTKNFFALGLVSWIYTRPLEPTLEWIRDRAQGRGHRPRGDGRAAARDPEHPARGPLHRHADQDRAGGSDAGALRPQQRIAGGGAGAGDTGRLLLHRLRGGAHRGQVHGAGDRALRRLPGQRLGAVAHPGSHHAAAARRAVPHGEGRFLSVPARPRDALAAVGAARHAGARAPHRRHREAGRHRQYLVRPRQPRPHGQDARREGATRGAGDSADHDQRPGHRGPARRRLGRHLRLHHGGGGARAGGRPVRRVGPPAPPEPAAAGPRPHPARISQGDGARDQQRPARARAARGVSRGRRRLQPRARPAAGERGNCGSDSSTYWEQAMSAQEAGAAAPTPKYTKKDFESDQDVRWCPGCGDYAILSAVQKSMPDLGIPRENIVFISGIGCSSRFPYYMNTYGFHTIHGRAPAIATGLRVARPDLKVFVVTGDGDGLSIGGNHMLHVLRRNVNLTILLFNNRIYGLTKGQYSPTSELGKVTKSTPVGSADRPVNPLSFALGCGATFVARTVDRNIPHMDEMLKRAAAHKGTGFVEILQNCNVYNDLAWNVIYDRESKVQHELRLEHGKPLLFGPPDDRRALIMEGVTPRVVRAKDVPESALWVHDEKNVNAAKLLADLFAPDFPIPVGVLTAVDAPVYEDLMLEQAP